MTADVVELRDVSRWYGNVVAVNGVSFSLGAGVTGLLGPNGAGKSTLLHMIAGLLHPSAGTVTVDGRATYGDPEVFRRVGLVPEREAVFGFLTGRAFVRLNADLQGVAAPADAVERALATVELTGAADRAARHVLEGDAPAGEGGRGARPRPGRPGPRRAVQRDGSRASGST